jgi:tRNA dimethylallyltransferase
MDEPPALIVAGPTCSGKSALAIALAERLGGTVINADSMQVYRELRVLTARPSPAEEAAVPHRLFGVRPAAEAGSVAWWRGAALEAMAGAWASTLSQRERAFLPPLPLGEGWREGARARRLPILCGGTGLYFAALTHGLADIPDPGPAARETARGLLAELGPAALHARLAEVDPAMVARLRPNDSQRIARAYEVWLGTGTPLSAWQARPGLRAPWRFAAILLAPPRTELRAAIAGRFAAMLRAGALEEVRALLALGLDPALPAMRAQGVPELSAHLRGEISLDEAARRAELVTGQYAKRQTTWYRHHELAPADRTHTIHARYAGLAQFSERERGELLNFVERVS